MWPLTFFNPWKPLIPHLEDERPHGREMKTTRELPTLTVTAGVQPRWIQDDSTVGMELASLEITYLITDREGLEN